MKTLAVLLLAVCCIGCLPRQYVRANAALPKNAKPYPMGKLRIPAADHVKSVRLRISR